MDIQNRFVSLWQDEYDATTNLHKLDGDIEIAERFSEDASELKAERDSLMKLARNRYNSIVTMIKAGEIDENAPEKFRQALGDLYGYVSDCYFECVTDAQI